MSNIHGLSFGSGDDKKKDDEEFNQGGKTSSTAVYRPTNSDIIKQARGNAQNGQPDTAPTAVITLYKNGFKVDDGEFRDSSVAANGKFLDDLKNGVVPTEMEPEIRAKMGGRPGQPVISLKDCTSEVFTPPPPKFSFDKSHGQSLAGGSGGGVVDLSSLSPVEYKLDGSPSTTIQLIAHDRKKHRVKMNLSATTAQLYQHVMSMTGQRTFSLLEGFPPKPLTASNSATIESAGLKGASVSQRV